jgi:hypothetical protein
MATANTTVDPSDAAFRLDRAEPFYECGMQGMNLFQVKPGVPVEDALSEVAMMLDDAFVFMNTTLQGVSGEDAVNVNQTIRLIDMSRAVLRSISINNQGRNQQRTQAGGAA